MFRKLKDPVSGLTHMGGAIFAIPCTIMLVLLSVKNASAWHVVSFSIFGAALFLLYTASTIYHLLPISEKASNVLRKIDHMMIFVLIAGTYTPVCLITLRGAWGFSILSIVWAIAIIGIIIKAIWINVPRWISTGIYVLMGWIVIIAFYPLAKHTSLYSLLLLIFGGVTYTTGAIIYATKWPKLNFKWFGFHEIFHIFVLGGSFFHVLFMFELIR